MKRRDFLKVIGAGACLATTGYISTAAAAASVGAAPRGRPEPAPTKPNIVLCMADNQGWGDMAYNDPILSRNGVAVQTRGESSTVTADAALEFIRRHARSSQPFLAVVWFGSPHGPHQAIEADRAHYAGQKKNFQNFYGEIAKQYPEDTFPGHAAWLDWPWKLHRIQNKQGNVTLELYNLIEDPMEQKDLFAQENNRVNSMKLQFEAWLASVVRSLNGKEEVPKVN